MPPPGYQGRWEVHDPRGNNNTWIIRDKRRPTVTLSENGLGKFFYSYHDALNVCAALNNYEYYATCWKNVRWSTSASI